MFQIVNFTLFGSGKVQPWNSPAGDDHHENADRNTESADDAASPTSDVAHVSVTRS